MAESVTLAKDASSEIVRLRRDFHQHPEISFQEERTSRVVHEYLEGLGLAVTKPDGMTGLWADFRVDGATRTLAFRADMDALAMDETAAPNKTAFLSQNPGAAHCCGHDSHMAMLLAAAKLLTTGDSEAKHNIRFLFQHAEEQAPGGAIELIEAGCLEGVDEVYGIHVIPSIPAGIWDVKAGPFMAAADEMVISVTGKGGHAAMPHLVRDPIVASASVVTALQQLVSRRASPLDAFVVSIATIRGGSGTSNVIPDSVEMRGTVRTLDAKLWEQAPEWIASTCRAAAEAAGCSATVDYRRGYPLLVNDPGATRKAEDAVKKLFGPERLCPPTAIMGGEDFARYAELRPSCYVFLGVGSQAKGIVSPNHATDFDVDEDVLHCGTAWFLELARS